MGAGASTQGVSDPWQWGPKALAIVLLILPSQLPPDLTASVSSPFLTQAGGREAGTGPEAHPKSAWEEGRQRPLTYTKAKPGPGTSPRRSGQGEEFPGTKMAVLLLSTQGSPSAF